MKLQLSRKSQGYYAGTDGKITITVSDASVVVGGKPRWQIVIENGDEIALNECCATKRECYDIGVRFLTSDIKL